MHQVLNEQITLVSINISAFSGYRRATREHIAALGGSLPTCKAITEGSIKVFPCEGTSSLLTVRRGVFRMLQSHGIRALGSQNVYAVRTDELPEIEQEIATKEAEFDVEIAALSAKYDAIFEAHVAENRQAESIIRSLKVERAEAIASCRFLKSVFKISPVVRPGESEDESVEGIVRGLGRQLYIEIAADMEKLSKHEAFVRQKVGQKTLRSIKATVTKMTKMAFLDDTVQGAITLVQDTLKSLPCEGYILGQPFQTLARLVEIMADPDDLLNAASKCRNGIAACDVLFPPAAAVAQQPVASIVTTAAQTVDVVVAAPVLAVQPDLLQEAAPVVALPAPVVEAVAVTEAQTEIETVAVSPALVPEVAPVVAETAPAAEVAIVARPVVEPVVAMAPIFVPNTTPIAAEKFVPKDVSVVAATVVPLLKPRSLLKPNSLMF